MSKSRLEASLVLALLLTPVFADAQQMPDPKIAIAAQKQALAPLAYLDGEWRGKATMTMPDGSTHEVTQTERVGPLLDGAVKLIEGRGYNADGSTGFNAFAVLSWDPDRKAFNFRSHAMGQAGDFEFQPNADGYIWKIPARPVTIRYTATIKNGKWREIGERIVEGQKPVQFFEMNLTRIGDSRWPAAGAVAAK